MRSKGWVWVAALAVLFAGITNAHAHLHLCFDGQESPASMHLGDESGHAHGHDHLADHGDDHDARQRHHAGGANGLDHDGDHADGHAAVLDDGDHAAPHDDADVDLENQALAKLAKHDDAPALASTPSWPHTFGPAAATLATSGVDLPPHPRRTYSLPLSRAPPR